MLTTDTALHGLRAEWQALWRRVPGASPFQSPDWLLPWWYAFGTAHPRVAVLRMAGRLAGVLPLYVLDGERKLLPIGAGLTDHMDALLAPDLPADAAALLLRAALAGATGIDACDLTDLPPGAALRTASPPPGWRAAWRQADPCPVLALAPDLRATVPARQLRKLRMARHRAERAGGWVVETATAETLEEMLAALMRLHGARWPGGGVFADPRVRAFHREAAPALLAAGALRLQVLRLGDAVAAACYALLAEGRILFYLSGFDAARGFESPGTLLLGAMLEQAASEGRREADFLRGGEAYKYAWGASDRLNAACHLEPVR